MKPTPHYPVPDLAATLYWDYLSEEAEFRAWEAQCQYEHQLLMEEFLNQGGQDSDNYGEFQEMYLVTAHHH